MDTQLAIQHYRVYSLVIETIMESFIIVDDTGCLHDDHDGVDDIFRHTQADQHTTTINSIPSQDMIIMADEKNEIQDIRTDRGKTKKDNTTINEFQLFSQVKLNNPISYLVGDVTALIMIHKKL